MKIKADNQGVRYMFRSLRIRNFRLYFMGQTISLTGGWIQQIAMSWLVYKLSGSVALLGTVFFVSQIPMFFILPFSSAIIDKTNKKLMLFATQALFMVHSILLSILYFTSLIKIWHILVLSFVYGLINSFDNPNRQAFYIELVPKDNILNAVALNSTVLNSTRLIGPAIAGVLIGIIGEGGCFLINSFAAFLSLGFILFIEYKRMSISQNKLRVIKDIKEALSYISSSLPTKAIMIIVFFFCFLVFPITTFIPAYVKDVLSLESDSLGLIMAFIGVGSLLASFFLASRKEILSLGRIQLVSLLASSILIIPFFFVKSIYLSLLLSVLLGFSIVGVIASTTTVLQALTSEDIKARILGCYLIFFTLGSSLGNLFLGWLSDIIGLAYAIGVSGFVAILAILIYLPYRKKVNKLTKDIYIEKGVVEVIPV